LQSCEQLHDITIGRSSGDGTFEPLFPLPLPRAATPPEKDHHWMKQSAVEGHLKGVTPLKTNMTVENPPFEDVFPIENGDFPM